MLTLALLALLPAILPTAEAKDLRNRVGLGFNTQLGHGVSATGSSTPTIPAVSVRFGIPTGSPNVNLQVELDGGLLVGAGEEARYVAGGRLLYGVVAEDNMNLYLGAGAGYVGVGSTGVVRLQPAAAAQFFLFGLENLGFSAEWGVSIDIGNPQGVRALTIGGAPAVGLHYYF